MISAFSTLSMTGLLLLFTALWVASLVVCVKCRRHGQSPASRRIDEKSKEENAENETATVEKAPSQSSGSKSEVRRQPLRYQVTSSDKTSSLENSSKRLIPMLFNVDVSYKERGTTSKLVAIHENKSHMIVPSQMSIDETLALLKTMTDFQPANNLITHGKSKPVTHKVVEYGVSDEITRRDKQPSFNEAIGRWRDILDRKVKHQLEPLLIQLVMNGPRHFNFAYEELRDVLERGAALYAKEPSLLEVPVPCMVYGDLHGQYSDLHRWFNLNGWPNQTLSVFLGDFVDRGSHGVEVVALITALKLTFPNRVFVIRGNHEEETLNRSYSFYAEVCQRFADKRAGLSSFDIEPRWLARFDQDISGDPDGTKMYGHFKKLFMQLPLAVLIGKRVLGVHGGISPKLTSLQDIRRIARPINDFDVGTLECDLVWSDPDVETKRSVAPFRPNFDREPNNGIGQLFSADSVKSVCLRLRIDLIIRGHQTPLQGYAFFADGHMVTLFSAPGYKGITSADVNMGAAIEFDRDMRMTIKKLKASEQFRRNRIADCEQRSSTNVAADFTVNKDPVTHTATAAASDKSIKKAFHGKSFGKSSKN